MGTAKKKTGKPLHIHFGIPDEAFRMMLSLRNVLLAQVTWASDKLVTRGNLNIPLVTWLFRCLHTLTYAVYAKHSCLSWDFSWYTTHNYSIARRYSLSTVSNLSFHWHVFSLTLSSTVYFCLDCVDRAAWFSVGIFYRRPKPLAWVMALSSLSFSFSLLEYSGSRSTLKHVCAVGSLQGKHDNRHFETTVW